jgi:6-phosphogluconolactonase (cycloisomerase 2 family)
MRIMRHLHLAVASLISLTAWAGPTILYVSESGEKRIAVFTMDERSGELRRTGAVDLPGGPGSLAVSADRRHL